MSLGRKFIPAFMEFLRQPNKKRLCGERNEVDVDLTVDKVSVQQVFFCQQLDIPPPVIYHSTNAPLTVQYTYPAEVALREYSAQPLS
jgi:hypothetical protein